MVAKTADLGSATREWLPPNESLPSFRWAEKSLVTMLRNACRRITELFRLEGAVGSSSSNLPAIAAQQAARVARCDLSLQGHDKWCWFWLCCHPPCVPEHWAHPSPSLAGCLAPPAPILVGWRPGTASLLAQPVSWAALPARPCRLCPHKHSCQLFPAPSPFGGAADLLQANGFCLNVPCDCHCSCLHLAAQAPHLGCVFQRVGHWKGCAGTSREALAQQRAGVAVRAGQGLPSLGHQISPATLVSALSSGWNTPSF